MRIFLFLYAIQSAASAADAVLDKKIQAMLEKSLPRMSCNFSTGAPGSIIASPEAEDPDYYFHWIRDSALVVGSMSRLLPKVEGTPNEAEIRKMVKNFTKFSEKLQYSPTPYGAGETRFNVDGSVDNSKWPRPQYDGPALRALALLDYLERNGSDLDRNTKGLMEEVAKKDLDSVAKYYRRKGFDLWEYANGFHFYTRMTQLGALTKGEAYFRKNPHRVKWTAAALDLRKQLPDHWRQEYGFISRPVRRGEVTDSDGHVIQEDEPGYDTSVSLAVNHADLRKGDFGSLDKRIWSSLWEQEEYFLKNFPVNVGKKLGPAIGRGPGDNYYGGNAFFFLTAAFAEHHFRIAKLLAEKHGALVAEKERLATLRHVLQRPVKEGENFSLPNAELAAAFRRSGEAFLTTMLDAIPSDGMMAEQMSKQDGSPASARDLTWSYASLLTAILQREELGGTNVDFSKLRFVCPDPQLGKRRMKPKQKTAESEAHPSASEGQAPAE